MIREEEQETEVTTEKTTQELEIKATEATEATEATNQESVKQDYSKEIKSVNLVGLNDKLPDEDKLVYVVKSGDTLNKIAKVHNTTVEKLLSINHLKNPNIIRVGQEIIIYSDGEQLDNLSKPQTKLGFVEVLSEYAEVVAQEQNLYASVMIAQASLETGFGKSSLSTEPNHNLYGMKGSYQGQSVVMRTKEYSPAKGWYYINAHFKKYPSYLESLIDHALYIRKGVSWNSNYYSGVWRENTNSYKDATAWLQGRYATDPNYAAKLNNIIEKYDLTRYDYEKNADSTEPEEDSSSGNNNVEKPVTPSTGGKEENTVIYKVKKGDTLSHIARAYKTTVRELKSINNLKTDLIIVGQELQIGKKNVAESKPNPKPEEKPSVDASKVYKVKKGDTLSHIARAYKTTVRELK
ncbi:MAG: LysM peptidoglycan-binding domain-containing protein, partial [Atopostipes suicloacalis]|nr:LysM peptidoglycan-binding domain-containing protein [Atopostipes suicloacalis]